jgi:hypothetical protein
LQSRDCTFASGTRPFDSDVDILNAKLHGSLGSLLCSTLSGKRRAFSATLKTTSAAAGPTKRVATRIRNRHARVIKRCLYVHNRNGHIATRLFSFGFRHRGISFVGMRIELTEILDALFARNRFLRPFASSGICTRPLASHGKTSTVS